MAAQSHYDFFVGTFNTPNLYTLRFTPASPSSASSSPSPARLTIHHKSALIGSHSWLHLSPPRPSSGVRNLYATAWTEPPSVVAYAVESATSIHLLNTAPTRSRSGYVAASDTALYSAGGATGEVFALDSATGAIVAPSASTSGEGTGEGDSSNASGTIQPLQGLDFVNTTAGAQRDDGSVMDFGGLRHGAHSADLSPSGHALYVADIGRNCIWVYGVSAADGTLTLGEKHISPRGHDGPRHVWPHPGGRVAYCVQEHSSMVDVFEVSGGGRGTTLRHVQGVRIIPEGEDEKEFWADEVRTSLSGGEAPRFLYASTRGLEAGKKGYVAVYALKEDGRIDVSRSGSGGERETSEDPYAGLLYMYTTPTSGGWANAVQPGPTIDGVEYLALTDSEQGFVYVLSWDGKAVSEVARTQLEKGEGAATAVWM